MLHGGGKEGEGVVGNFLTCFSTSIVLLSWQCRSGWEEKEEGEESYSAVPNIILPPVPLPPTRDPSTPSKLMEEAGEEDKWTMEESQWELVGGRATPLHCMQGREGGRWRAGGRRWLSSFPLFLHPLETLLEEESLQRFSFLPSLASLPRYLGGAGASA